MAQNTITTKGILIINGKQVENTFKDLQATTRKLEAELRKLKPGTQEFIDKAEQVKRARAAFENVKAEIRATTQELEKSGKSFSSFFNKTNVLTGLLSFEGLRAGWHTLRRDDAEIKKRQHMLVAIRGAIEEYIEARNIYKTENQKLTDLLNVNADLNSRNKGEENEEEGSTVYYTPPQNSKGEDNKPLKSPKDYSSEYRNAQKARLQAEKELQKEITQGLEESLDKQLAMTEQKYNEKKFKLQQENVDLNLEIQKLQEEAKTNKDPNLEKAIEEKRQLIEINKKIEVEFEKQKQAELQEVRDLT